MLLFIILLTLIVILVVGSITTGGFIMIDELESYKCSHVNIGIIVYFSSSLAVWLKFKPT
mgnify:CR=1 FL=1